MQSKLDARHRRKDSWLREIASEFRFPELEKPTKSQIAGAVVVGGFWALLLGASYEFDLSKFDKRPSNIFSAIVVTCLLAYLGAMAFGAVAFFFKRRKSPNFWRLQAPVAVTHWFVGIWAIGMLLLVLITIDQTFLAAKPIAQMVSGKFGFLVALLLFSLRSAWYGLRFSFPRIAPCQYLVFFLAFTSLLYHYGLLPSPDDILIYPTVIPAVTAWFLLLMDRTWRRVEVFSSGQIERIGTMSFLILLTGNIVVVGDICAAIWVSEVPRVTAIALTIPMVVILVGSLIGLANLKFAER